MTLTLVLLVSTIVIPPSSDDGYIIPRALNLADPSIGRPLDIIVRNFIQFQGAWWELLIGTILRSTDSLAMVRLPGVILAVLTWILIDSMLKHRYSLAPLAFAVWTLAAVDLATSLRPEIVTAFLSAVQLRMILSEEEWSPRVELLYWTPSAIAMATHQTGIVIVVLAAAGSTARVVKRQNSPVQLLRGLPIGLITLLIVTSVGPPLREVPAYIASYADFVALWGIPYGPPIAPHLELNRVQNLLPGGNEFAYVVPTMTLLLAGILFIVWIIVRLGESTKSPEWSIVITSAVLSISLTSSKWATHYYALVPLLLVLSDRLDESSVSWRRTRFELGSTALWMGSMGALAISMLTGGRFLMVTSQQLPWSPVMPQWIPGLFLVLSLIVIGTVASGHRWASHTPNIVAFVVVGVALLRLSLPLLESASSQSVTPSFASSHLASMLQRGDSCGLAEDIRMDDGSPLNTLVPEGSVVYSEMGLMPLMLCRSAPSPVAGLWTIPRYVLAAPSNGSELSGGLNTNFLVPDLYQKRACSVDLGFSGYPSFCVYELGDGVVVREG